MRRIDFFFFFWNVLIFPMLMADIQRSYCKSAQAILRPRLGVSTGSLTGVVFNIWHEDVKIISLAMVVSTRL